jgi:hypothetical protein
MKAGSARDTAYFTRLRAIFADKAYADLKHDVDAAYPNLDKQTEELTDAFKHIKYYYPKKNLPKLYAYFSGFEAQTAIGDGYFGIGLDLFLGADSKFYPSLVNAFPRYVSRRFTPDNITPRVVEGMAREDMFPEDEREDRCLLKWCITARSCTIWTKYCPMCPILPKLATAPNKQNGAMIIRAIYGVIF